MNFNNKIFGWVVLVLLGLSFFFNIQQRLKNRSLKDYRAEQFEKLKAEKDSIIQSQQYFIDSLVVDNKIKDLVIENAQGRYDSLQKKKDSVRYIIQGNRREIEGFNATELEQYWQNEFN